MPRRKPGGVVDQSPLDPYPRNRAGIIRGLVGKKVTLSTTDFHYLVGRLTALGDDDFITVAIGDGEVRLPRTSVATIREADGALVEYLK
ncbi:MAG: hypothetical protein ABUS79_17235 [Pseudomonadota bacterium]